MKLVTFSDRSGIRLGALIVAGTTSLVVDLARAAPSLPVDMLGMLRDGERALAMARDAIEEAKADTLLPESQVTLHAPLPRPGKIICVGHNYHGHTGATPPVFPDIFSKFPNVVIGPRQPIILPCSTAQVDYEAELAVVISKRARHVPPEHALNYVAGYTIFNDVTARDYQKRTSQWTLGKTFDTFGPMGPALVTREDVPNPGALELTLAVNGQVRQRANTRALIFSVPFLIAYLSDAMTLEPGDLISTGTPSGTGSSMKPPVYLTAGDVVTIWIERIGELENPVAAEIAEETTK